MAISSRRWFSSQFLHQLARGADQLVDRFDHVHRDANGAGLIGDGAGDGLANPPGGVGGELVAAAIFELVDGLHQADVAFLNQVQELQAAVGVFLGDGNHQAQVGFDQLPLRLLRVHVPLDDFALRALELLERNAGFDFELFHFRGCREPGCGTPCSDPRCGWRRASFQVLALAVERAHAVDGFVDAVNQALAFVVGEAQFADDATRPTMVARQGNAVTAIVLGTLLSAKLPANFSEQLRPFCTLGQVVDFAGELFQAVLQDLVGDFFFVEGDHFLDGANAFFQVFAHGQQFRGSRLANATAP